MRILKGFLRWAPRVLAGLLLTAAILIGTGVLNARVVLSDSMEPAIYKNDLVIGGSWLKATPGDIAIYQERDIATGTVKQDVVHRVITISESGEFLFKGDNNTSEDALKVPSSDVRGVVFMKIPSIGGLFNPLGLLATVGVIGGMWALGFGILTLSRGKHTENEE